MQHSHKSRLAAGIALALLLLLAGAVSAAEWRVPGDFAAIQAALDSPLVVQGDTIRVGSGTHAGALVTKAVSIKGEGGATIGSGPAHSSGLIQGFRLLAGSDGCTISHLRFTVDLAIMNGTGVHDVTVTQCAFVSPVQGISNWRGCRWEISHNEILDLRTRNGGGIGILVGDYTGGTVCDNVISHNKITGILHVASSDGGGYSGTGIVLYADFRWGRLGASELSWNRVVKNTIGLISDRPAVVDVVGIELSDTGEDPTLDVICDNAIGFNDLRDTAQQIVLTPAGLDSVNSISRNLGENRGHGLGPASVFSPGN